MTVDKNALFNRLLTASEALSSAMVYSEGKGADYSLIEDQWSDLTAAIQAVYEAKKNG